MTQEHYEFGALNDKEFKGRIKSNFPAAYLTLISIVQGVAFYFVINNSNALINPERRFNPFLIYSLISFGTIIVVFYMYSYYVSITCRPPSFRESFIPFTLGLTEILPMQFFSSPRWWFFFYGVFCVGGVMAYLNTLAGLHSSDFSSKFRQAYDDTRRETWKNILWSVAGAIDCFWAFWRYPSLHPEKTLHFIPEDWLPITIIGCVLVAMVLTTEVDYLRPLYRHFKLSGRC